MPTIYVNNAGTFTAAKEIFVKDTGSWKTVKEVWVKQAGVWTKAYPESGAISYASAGTYSFTVPNGIYTVTATLVVGSGGGGGSSIFSGDSHGAANGGSGGFYTNQTFAVTPGQIYTIKVGAVGASGVSGGAGGAGGESSIYLGTTPIFVATGGGGGAGCVGDNAPAFGGAGGSPGGVAGSYTATWMSNRNTPGQGYDGQGQNGTGWGSGGLGGNPNGGYAPQSGGLGRVALAW